MRSKLLRSLSAFPKTVLTARGGRHQAPLYRLQEPAFLHTGIPQPSSSRGHGHATGQKSTAFLNFNRIFCPAASASGWFHISDPAQSRSACLRRWPQSQGSYARPRASSSVAMKAPFPHFHIQHRGGETRRQLLLTAIEGGKSWLPIPQVAVTSRMP